MTEVEQARDVFMQSHTPAPLLTDSHHHSHSMTSSSSRDRHRYNRHTVHNPHNAHKGHQSHNKHSSPRGKRALPPGWEVVQSDEGGVYYWHKRTGKTTWKFPSSEAKEHQKKKQSHTYINIRPGYQPCVVTSDDVGTDHATSGHSNSSHSNTAQVNGSTSPHGSGGFEKRPASGGSLNTERDRGSEGVPQKGEGELVSSGENHGVGSMEGNDAHDARAGEWEYGQEASPAAMEGEMRRKPEKFSSDIDSPPGVRRRPLVVHNYENFPFNPNGKTPPSDSEATPDGSGELVSPTRSRAESNASSASSAPPIPERHYSQSDINRSPTHNHTHSPYSDGDEEQESRESLSPLHQLRGQSRPREVQREMSEQGNEYAVINPAWKKNVKGRSPSLSRINDPDAVSKENPPPLPDRPPSLTSPSQTSDTSRVDLDSSLVQQKRAELEISSRFAQSVRYVDVELGGKVQQQEITQSRPRSRGNVDVTYDTINFPNSQPEGDYTTVGAVDQRRSGSGRLRSERWLKTQSAFVTSPQNLTPPPPPPPPRQTTPTGNSACLTPTDPRAEEEEEEEELPVVPPKMGLASREVKEQCDISANSRRLHAMNVTIRRQSESEGGSGKKMRGMKLSKQALLLRSGVTLRPGVRPPMSLSKVEGGEGESGTDEEDGLEPVTKAIKSLESRITSHPQKQCGDGSAGQEEGEGEEEGKEGVANLMLVPDGPPKWLQFQRQAHKYEDITILDDSSMHAYLTGHKGSFKSGQGNAKSVGNLHMAWDESDIRSQPAMVKPVERGESQLVSASQPCLVDVNLAFPHLEKPNRVSDHAFQLRKLRLLHHKYEDIDIPEWTEIGGIPGSVTSVGDVPSPAVRNSWLEAEKDNAVTDSGTLLPKGWQRMTDEQKKTYYWHIPTGQTQYTKPTGENVEGLLFSAEGSSQPLSDQSDYSASSSTNVTPSMHPKPEVKVQKFSACYFGNHPVEEGELVPGECVKVVHRSIRKTHSTANIKGQPIFLVVQGMELQWMEPESPSPTTVQPINRIRVWGIGLENDRDFGYVARDQVTKKHKCHVFRCEMPARAVAKALLENHQKLSKTPPTTTPVTTATTASSDEGVKGSEPTKEEAGSPGEMPAGHERMQTESGTRGISPPSGVGEPVESMTCVYIGSCEVLQSQGIEILNAAVEKLCSNSSRWVDASINITTSHIRITETGSDRAIGEHRVRYLCFLGIAKDDRYCGYILESARGKKQAEKKFLFHGFKMEPNTDKLCLALHTACQARYQKVLESQSDAQRAPRERTESDRLRSKSTSSILGRLGSFKKNRKDDESKVFTVQYLGCQQVTRSEGLEVVKGPIQQLSIPKSAIATTPAHLVDFEISPAGLGVTDPNKKVFSKKNFSVKHITYVVRIRNYFAFVVRDGSRYQCYVFLETSVPAATIVTTIQRMLAPEPSKKR